MEFIQPHYSPKERLGIAVPTGAACQQATLWSGALDGPGRPFEYYLIT